MTPPTWLHWPAAWAPTDVSGLLVWYKADEIGQSDDTEISEWSDASGNGYHMTGLGTPKPKFRTNIQNGLGVVRFNGSGYFERAVWAGYPSNNASLTVAAVFKSVVSVVSPYNQQFVTAGTVSGPRQDNVSITSGDYRVLRRQQQNSTVRAVVSDSSAPVGYQTYVAGLNSAVEPFIRSNGSNVAFTYGGAYSNLTLNDDDPTHIGLGSLRGSEVIESGTEIAEVVMYDTDLSLANQQRLEGYLAHKWGLTGDLPGGHPYKTLPP